jgi:hypothetical protein
MIQRQAIKVALSCEGMLILRKVVVTMRCGVRGGDSLRRCVVRRLPGDSVLACSGAMSSNTARAAIRTNAVAVAARQRETGVRVQFPGNVLRPRFRFHAEEPLMRLPICIALVVFAASSASCSSDNLPEIGVCIPGQLPTHVADRGDVAAHRQAPTNVSVITYPFGTQREGDWGLDLTLAVDASGKVVCYSNLDRFDRPQQFTPKQRELIGTLKQWRYDPFKNEGLAVASVVMEHVDEVEAVEKHIPLPDVSLDQVVIVLDRGPCLGTCADYRVEIHGDGSVVYDGRSHADVLGKHTYHVPVENVRKLVDSLREKDLWSLRPSYRGAWTDFPNYTLTLSFGNETKVIDDYIGQLKGMPAAVTEFENEVDKLAQSAMKSNKVKGSN